MKNLTKFQKILIVVLVVCLIVGFTAMLLTRTTSREPTAEEIARYSPCDVMWDSLPSEEGQSRTDAILALCRQGEDTQIGENRYATYTSDTLCDYLGECASVERILVSDEGNVLISYTTADGMTVTLSCDADGTAEQSVYDPEKDLLFYTNRAITVVYENFSNYSTF